MQNHNKRASIRLHVTSSFSAFLYPLLHADGESETDETTKRDEVKSGSDRVQETELLVGLVHSGGWLYVSGLHTPRSGTLTLASLYSLPSNFSNLCLSNITLVA